MKSFQFRMRTFSSADQNIAPIVNGGINATIPKKGTFIEMIFLFTGIAAGSYFITGITSHSAEFLFSCIAVHGIRTGGKPQVTDYISFPICSKKPSLGCELPKRSFHCIHSISHSLHSYN